MITNPILCNNLVTIGAVLCGLIVLAVIMLPKALRHKKQIKQRQEENTDDGKNENS